MGLRESNKQDKRERLIRAAHELFSEQGFDSTTTRQIAERAGIGVGTIFLYARDKRSLLFLLFSDAVLGVQREAFASLPTKDPTSMAQSGSTGEPGGPVPAGPPRQAGRAGLLLPQLMHIFSRFYRYYTADRHLSRLFIKELLFMDGDPQASDGDGQKHLSLTLEFVGRLTALVQQAQARGELRGDFDPLLATTNFFATYFLTLVGLLDPVHGASLDAELATVRLQAALQLQINGLMPSTTRADADPAPRPDRPPSRRPRPKASGRRQIRRT